jgi:hypothetical protein
MAAKSKIHVEVSTFRNPMANHLCKKGSNECVQSCRGYSEAPKVKDQELDVSRIRKRY